MGKAVPDGTAFFDGEVCQKKTGSAMTHRLFRFIEFNGFKLDELNIFLLIA